jgi:hypothetical protein
VGIRQKLNDKPALTVGVAVIVIAAAGLVAFRTSCSDDGARADAGVPPKQFFTTDQGPGPQLFVDDATKVPPFDHDGKPAYRARVYRCSHGKQFVSNLERFSEADRKRLQDAIDRSRSTGGHMPSPDSFFNAMEVKKPGDKEWVRLTPATRDKYERILRPVCPEGSTDGITPVIPQ